MIWQPRSSQRRQPHQTVMQAPSRSCWTWRVVCSMDTAHIPASQCQQGCGLVRRLAAGGVHARCHLHASPARPALLTGQPWTGACGPGLSARQLAASSHCMCTGVWPSCVGPAQGPTPGAWLPAGARCDRLVHAGPSPVTQAALSASTPDSPSSVPGPALGAALLGQLGAQPESQLTTCGLAIPTAQQQGRELPAEPCTAARAPHAAGMQQTARPVSQQATLQLTAQSVPPPAPAAHMAAPGQGQSQQRAPHLAPAVAPGAHLQLVTVGPASVCTPALLALLEAAQQQPEVRACLLPCMVINTKHTSPAGPCGSAFEVQTPRPRAHGVCAAAAACQCVHPGESSCMRSWAWVLLCAALPEPGCRLWRRALSLAGSPLQERLCMQPWLELAMTVLDGHTGTAMAVSGVPCRLGGPKTWRMLQGLALSWASHVVYWHCPVEQPRGSPAAGERGQQLRLGSRGRIAVARLRSCVSRARAGSALPLRRHPRAATSCRSSAGCCRGAPAEPCSTQGWLRDQPGPGALRSRLGHQAGWTCHRCGGCGPPAVAGSGRHPGSPQGAPLLPGTVTCALSCLPSGVMDPHHRLRVDTAPAARVAAPPAQLHERETSQVLIARAWCRQRCCPAGRAGCPQRPSARRRARPASRPRSPPPALCPCVHCYERAACTRQVSGVQGLRDAGACSQGSDTAAAARSEAELTLSKHQISTHKPLGLPD